MQRYSQQIPWIWVEHTGSGYLVHCEACDASGHIQMGALPQFVGAHTEHRSPGGFGLGDAIAAVAKPIARAFGKAPCTPCEARRKALNAAMPRVWPR